jgi:hypothetical protein
MNRAILEACLPCLVALGVAFAAMVGLVKLSGARFKIARLRQIHACEGGGVQSLAFVLTLPVFMLFVLFILQVSQLMVGTMVVNYAAFAAARSASVWLPATVDADSQYGFSAEPDNWVEAGVQINGNILRVGSNQSQSASNTLNSRKCFQAWTAAVLGCASICPSRDLQRGGTSTSPVSNPATSWLPEAQRVTRNVYGLLSPASSSNGRIPVRLDNKLDYAARNTFVEIEWQEVSHSGTDVETGPTYNPRGHCTYVWQEKEVGYRDPVTVWVTHRHALLPGPGRFLAKLLVPASGVPDRIAPLVGLNPEYSEPVHFVTITASATLVNEGIKSVMPYVQR